MNIYQFIDQGGVIVLILIAMLGFGLIIMLWKFLILLSFMMKKKDRCKDCIEVLPQHSDISMIELVVHEKMHSLERGLESVKIIATISPLLGLLGTVIGIYSAFVSISTHGLGDPSFFADGISMAMITTIAGLIVAIPHYIGYNYLVSMMDKLELSFTQEIYTYVKLQDA
ncbi:MAG: MotA/TolQ/ExbB proton channel family protein [Sulfurimonas sp.]|jgi:biopolymer transport protein ExbB|nr:MotA/TolQ/ExbB proton channel family protein [Sulfurimonas sp.]